MHNFEENIGEVIEFFEEWSGYDHKVWGKDGRIVKIFDVGMFKIFEGGMGGSPPQKFQQYIY